MFSQYRGGDIHARISVAYTYECRGHDIEVGIFNDTQFVPFVRGPGIQLASIEASGTVSIGDRNPTFTKNYAMFEPGCMLFIVEVGAAPSTQTLAQLAQEAQAQARLLSYADTLFRLGASWANLSQWTDSELADIKEELELLRDVADYPQDIEKLIAVVQLARDNQPLPPDLGQSGDNVQQLKNHLRSKVMDELRAAEALEAAYVEFSHWANPPPTLTEAINRARSI